MIKSKKIIAVLATFAMLFFGAFALFLIDAEQNRAFANETNPVVLMVDGAEIRISTDNSGLRFIGKVSKNYFTDAETPTLRDGVTVGMLLGKGEVTAENLTLENVVSKDLKNAVITKWDISRSKDEGYINFNVAITTIPKTDYGVSVIARAYVTENNSTIYSENTCTRSVAEVADAALAENAITNELNDTAKGICQNFVANDAAALTVDGLTVLDGKVKWNENSNAKGYFVNYNGVTAKVANNEYSLPVSECDSVVKVVAYGNGVNYTYSAIASKSVHVLAENELANFNNATYENDVVGGSIVPATYTTFSQNPNADINSVTPKYESNVEDSNGGALLISPIITAYQEGGMRHAVFTVNLQNPLDFTNHKGIKIRMQFKECTKTTAGDVYFKLVGDEIGEGYITRFKSAANTDLPDTVSPQTDALEAGKWVELSISNAQLTSYYKNGTDKLYFAFVTTEMSDATKGECMTVSAYLDYISQYDDPHVLAYDELANFDNASYNNDITCGPVAANSENTDYTDMRTSGYVSNVEGSTNGAMYINKWICSYGSGNKFEGVRRNVVFGVKLQEGLDVTKDIVVRFKIEGHDYDNNGSKGIGLQLVGADNDTQNYTGYEYRKVATVGEWAELKLSASDLAACGYKNGDTLIVFALRCENGRASGTGAAKIYVDYIKYYTETETAE